MRKFIASFLLAGVVLAGVPGGLTSAGAASKTQEPGDEQWQPAKPRDFGDSIFTGKRRPPSQRPAKRPAPRRKYQRVGVAGSSSFAFKHQKPSAGGQSAAARKRRPSVPAKPAADWHDVQPASSEQIGVTVWRLRPCRAGGRNCFLELRDAQGWPVMYEAVRVSADADFRVGDGIQLGIESPVERYVYVVHQEVYWDDSVSEPKLLYPLREHVNAVGPGRPLLIPKQVAGEGVKVLKMQNGGGKRLKAERLKVIVARRPLQGVFVEDRPRHLGLADVQLWDAQWAGRLELFDLAGGSRERMSLEEWYAMQDDRGRGRDLTTADLAPQKLYMVERRRDDGVLITLDLPYAR